MKRLLVLAVIVVAVVLVGTNYYPALLGKDNAAFSLQGFIDWFRNKPISNVASNATPSTIKMLVIPIDSADMPHTDAETKAIAEAMKNLKNYYKDVTYNKYDVEYKVLPFWVRLNTQLNAPRITNQVIRGWMTDAVAVLGNIDSTINPDDYAVTFIVSPRSSDCGIAGCRFLPTGFPGSERFSTEVFINGANQHWSTYTHESLHVLGVNHFGKAVCAPVYTDNADIESLTCKGLNYYRTVAGHERNGSLTAVLRRDLSSKLSAKGGPAFFGEDRFEKVTATGKHTISAIGDSSSEKKKVLKIPVKLPRSGYGDALYIEYRTPIGLDKPAAGYDIGRVAWITKAYQGLGFKVRRDFLTTLPGDKEEITDRDDPNVPNAPSAVFIKSLDVSDVFLDSVNDIRIKRVPTDPPNEKEATFCVTFKASENKEDCPDPSPSPYYSPTPTPYVYPPPVTKPPVWPEPPPITKPPQQPNPPPVTQPPGGSYPTPRPSPTYAPSPSSVSTPAASPTSQPSPSPSSSGSPQSTSAAIPKSQIGNTLPAAQSFFERLLHLFGF
ncbi:hypothetical protein KW782_00975 [Candidatus Parcubacteria bacterium]|nr:hypothetical protein [Candidatus Parcubacteria bacterium]